MGLDLPGSPRIAKFIIAKWSLKITYVCQEIHCSFIIFKILQLLLPYAWANPILVAANSGISSIVHSQYQVPRFTTKFLIDKNLTKGQLSYQRFYTNNA